MYNKTLLDLYTIKMHVLIVRESSQAKHSEDTIGTWEHASYKTEVPAFTVVTHHTTLTP